MNQGRFCLFVIALMAVTTTCIGQDTQSDKPLELKPFFGLGIGSYTYYGDISPVNFGYEPTVSDLGYRFTISNNILKGVDLSLEATFGKLTGNQRTLKRNLNFQSEIRSGGINLSYDFSHLLNDSWTLKPFISVGFTSFEFLSKTDLYDANGNLYHYWRDGTIRNIAEGDPNAESAVFLVRDYDYETDLRELNLDGLGEYDEQSFAIPVGAGAKFDLTPNLKFLIQSQYYFAQTDLIDNVSADGTGRRKGGDKNDGFLYSSASLLVHFPKKSKVPSEKLDIDKELLASIDRADEDGDGVNDMLDKCPFTPSGVEVNSEGCPKDSDKDGVPDYRDNEIDSPLGAEVDSSGVLLGEEYFSEQYYFFIDTLSGGPKVLKDRVESASIDIPERPRAPKKTVYMVQVGSNGDGVSHETAQVILSIPDVRTIQSDDTTMFMVGSYDQLHEAVRRKMKLEQEGLNGIVFSDGEEGVINRSVESDEIESTLVESAASNFQGTIWRVQIGAFKNELSENLFTNVPDFLEIKGDDGLTRYTSGSFRTLGEAANHKVDLLLKGFVGSFITVYRNGGQISLAEAGITSATKETKSPEEQWNEPSTNAFNKDLISYSVLLTSTEGELRTETLNNFLQIGGVTQMTYDGKVHYLFENFSTAAFAQESVDVVSDRFPEAKVVGLFDGKLISREEAEAMFKN